MYGYLSNDTKILIPNSIMRKLEKYDPLELCLTSLDNDQNSSEHRESWHAILSTKCVDKSTIKFLF